MQKTGKRLAIIGTGIAGLSAAWLLRDRYDIVVFESAPRAGMGAHKVDYESKGVTTRIDIPLRIFCRGYYANLMALYDHIGVEMRTSDHAGVFADHKGRVVFHYGNLRMGSTHLSYLKPDNTLSGDPWRIALYSRKFFRQAQRDAENSDSLASLTFAEYLHQRQVPSLLTETILLPMLSATCTCDYNSVLSYPADIMLGYLGGGIHNFGVMSATGGVDDIVPRLLNGADLKTSCPVADVSETLEGLTVTTRAGDSEQFDHVIVASQAQQAASLLVGFEEHTRLLEKIPFERSTMSVHTDRDILPRSLTPISPVSYMLPGDGQRAQVSVDLTRAFNRFRRQSTVFQTWNPMRDPAEGKELARVDFTRPVVTHASREAVRALQKLQQRDDNRLWFCGSYMTERVPLLDAAVDASMVVAERLGASIPWKTPG